MIADKLKQAQQELYRKRQEAIDGRNGHDPLPIRDISPLVKNPRPAPVFDEPEKLTGLLANGRVCLDSLDISHPKMKQAVKMARTWAERKRGGCADASIVLCGDNGVGKTHIALAIWWAITIKVTDAGNKPLTFGEPLPGYTDQPLGKFFLSNDLIAKLGNSKDPETAVTSPTRAAEAIGFPPLIVIDDVGLEQTIPFVGKEEQENERHARFFKVFNHCYGNVSVVLTSNLSWPELSTYIGKRAADRLGQMCPMLPNGDSFIVDLFGLPSYRRKAGGR